MSRVLSIGLLLAGITLVGLAAFNYFTPTDAPGVTIQEPEREFPDAAARQTIGVTFTIHNPTRHTARVIGLVMC